MPSVSATLYSSQPSRLGQVLQPVQEPAFCGSRWYLKQSSRSSHTMQALGCSDSMSSRMLWRRSTSSPSLVVTFIPSATGVVHAGTTLRMPSTLTRHIRQAPNGASLGWLQSVGM
jgi:hypothetical protein